MKELGDAHFYPGIGVAFYGGDGAEVQLIVGRIARLPGIIVDAAGPQHRADGAGQYGLLLVQMTEPAQPGVHAGILQEGLGDRAQFLVHRFHGGADRAEHVFVHVFEHAADLVDREDDAAAGRHVEEIEHFFPQAP